MSSDRDPLRRRFTPAEHEASSRRLLVVIVLLLLAAVAVIAARESAGEGSFLLSC